MVNIRITPHPPKKREEEDVNGNYVYINREKIFWLRLLYYHPIAYISTCINYDFILTIQSNFVEIMST